MPLTIHKGYVSGAIGRIVELHAVYYKRFVGFGPHFESKVASDLSVFCQRYVEDRDGMWLALDGSNIEGSIAIDGLRAAQEGAHLRWFITSDCVRGMGIGNALISEATDFCRRQRFGRVYLWTFEGLGVARHLYEKCGFRLVYQQRGTQWGSEVEEQRFELVL